nr:MAG TPA: hypothetical protein [Caudoviricetes sp.]
MRREGETPSVRGSLPPAPRPRFSRLCSRCSSLSRSRRLRASPCAAGLAPHGRAPSASETWCPRRRSRAAGCGKIRQTAPPRRRPRSHPRQRGRPGHRTRGRRRSCPRRAPQGGVPAQARSRATWRRRG